MVTTSLGESGASATCSVTVDAPPGAMLASWRHVRPVHVQPGPEIVTTRATPGRSTLSVTGASVGAKPTLLRPA